MGARDLAAKPWLVFVTRWRWHGILKKQVECRTTQGLCLVVLDEFKQALERALYSKFMEICMDKTANLVSNKVFLLAAANETVVYSTLVLEGNGKLARRGGLANKERAILATKNKQ